MNSTITMIFHLIIIEVTFFLLNIGMVNKKIIPSSLLGRSLIIVFIPIITLVILTTLVFYQTSWNIISKRLTQSVVADINVVVKLIDQNLKPIAIKIAKEDFKMEVAYKENKDLNPLSFRPQRGILSKRSVFGPQREVR